MGELSSWTVDGLEHVVELVGRRHEIASDIRETHAWIAYAQAKARAATARTALWRARLHLAEEKRASEALVVAAREQLIDALALLDKLEEAKWDFHSHLLALTEEFTRCQTQLIRAWRKRQKADGHGPPIESMPRAANDEDHRRVAEAALRTGRFLEPQARGARIRREQAEQLWNRELGEMPSSAEDAK